MKKYLFIVLMGLQSSLLAQNPINILRYNDNFSALKDKSNKTGFDKLKYVKLGEKTYLSFGGEIREQYQYFENQNFGDVPPSFKNISAGQLWHRAMAHANLEIGKKTRVFVQLNNTMRFFNPNPLTPEIDENQLSLHQAFVDYQFNPQFSIRAGRQEIGYGTTRLITFREGPNTRLTFDAAILKYQKQNLKIDLLAISPVISKAGVFDDESLKDWVYGVYATQYAKSKKIAADYYVLGFESNRRMYNYVAGNEKRQMVGTRVFSQNKTFNYEVEATYQIGKFNQKSIRAFGIAADLNYKLNSKNNVIIGVAAQHYTGDKNRNDGILNTYNLVFSKPSYGLAAPIGSSNIQNINPYFKFSPTKKLNLQAGVYWMQRQSIEDGTYSPGMAQVRPNREKLFNSKAKPIGRQYAIEVNYLASKRVTFSADWANFQAGTYTQQTGKGLNINYFSIKSSFKF
jgi:hypothetical protein